MFVLDKNKNRIVKINASTFSSLGYREREHLQEWIESNPDVFGEELLYIQKEFDGFGDTRERLDLLAIDKSGNLVVIENKLDDSGRDVTWQVLKYASYCSSLSKSQINDIYQIYLDKRASGGVSDYNISEFLGVEDLNEVRLNQSQRIILVSNTFRKEVTSTVMWLLNNYNLKIQCFKATPYLFDKDVIIDIEQIIPVKEAEEYTIKMAEKAQEEQNTQDEMKERYQLRVDFWKLLLQDFKTKSQLYININPTKDAWISAGSGISGVGFNFVVSKKYARVEVYISRSNADDNKHIFDKLYSLKDEINSKIAGIEWERLDDKKASRIKIENNKLSLFNKKDWPEMIAFMTEKMLLIEEVFGPLIVKFKSDKKLSKSNKEDAIVLAN